MVEIIQFPKKCPHCKKVLTHIKKMSATWFECENTECPYRASASYEYEEEFGYTCCVNRR
jgi:NAD-dependent DNA ligase